MDIFRIQSLIKEGKLLKPGDVKAEDIFLQAGVYKPNNRKIGAGNANAYPSFVVQGSQLKELLDITSGCPIEYTKINTHSFHFFPSNNEIVDRLWFGGNATYADLGAGNLTWSAPVYNKEIPYTSGAIENIEIAESTAGIPIPINLTPLDKVTITGTAVYTNAKAFIQAGYDVNLVIGVYYFNCNELTPDADAFTFIPVITEKFDVHGKVCFASEVTLGSNFDFHQTRLILGANIYVRCVNPGGCPTPAIENKSCTISYTIDIASPCEKDIPPPAQEYFYIIKNCCAPAVTELIKNVGPLEIGTFLKDSDENCWEVLEESTDVTNFSRTFVNTVYATCDECKASTSFPTGCPLNYKIQSCCPLSGEEIVTGSLPAGVSVGQAFVSTGGLIWNVIDTTGGPITEEAITTVIAGPYPTCAAALAANDCPVIIAIKSCCAGIGATIAVPQATAALLNVGDAFSDTNNNCWRVEDIGVDFIPTTYGIEVDTSSIYSGLDTCGDCKDDNPCPSTYYIQIQSCCTDRVEWAQVPAQYMTFSEGTVFSDYWGTCWTVLGFQTTAPVGVTTYYQIWDFTNLPNPSFQFYRSCNYCVCAFQKCVCRMTYKVKDCSTGLEYIVTLRTNGFTVLINNVYLLGIYNPTVGKTGGCFTIVEYGYPLYNPTNPSDIWTGSVLEGSYGTGDPACTKCKESA